MTIPAKRWTEIYKRNKKITACLGIYVKNILIKYLGGISEELFRNNHKKSELCPPSRLLSVKMSLLCLSTRWQTEVLILFMSLKRDWWLNEPWIFKCFMGIYNKILNILFLNGYFSFGLNEQIKANVRIHLFFMSKSVYI